MHITQTGTERACLARYEKSGLTGTTGRLRALIIIFLFFFGTKSIDYNILTTK
jgi:hypothetical protein